MSEQKRLVDIGLSEVIKTSSMLMKAINRGEFYNEGSYLQQMVSSYLLYLDGLLKNSKPGESKSISDTVPVLDGNNLILFGLQLSRI
jgi:hypothetical protein